MNLASTTNGTPLIFSLVTLLVFCASFCLLMTFMLVITFSIIWTGIYNAFYELKGAIVTVQMPGYIFARNSVTFFTLPFP